MRSVIIKHVSKRQAVSKKNFSSLMLQRFKGCYCGSSRGEDGLLIHRRLRILLLRQLFLGIPSTWKLVTRSSFNAPASNYSCRRTGSGAGEGVSAASVRRRFVGLVPHARKTACLFLSAASLPSQLLSAAQGTSPPGTGSGSSVCCGLSASGDSSTHDLNMMQKTSL